MPFIGTVEGLCCILLQQKHMLFLRTVEGLCYLLLTVEGLCRVKLEMFTIGAAGQRANGLLIFEVSISHNDAPL